MELSIIVPVYNVERYLNRCIDSILAQDYSDYELILVDDGSQDSSKDICDDYKKENSNIIVIHKENGGLGSARNAGLDAATGRYISFIDGDDYIDHDHFTNMMRTINENDADTCLAGHTRNYFNHSVIKPNVCSKKKYDGKDIPQNILTRMCGKKPNGTDYIEMSVCMVVFSNDIIQSHNIRFHSEREFISEDLIFGFDYYPCCKRVVVSDDVGYHYCDNEGSLTTKYNPERFNKQKIMTKEVIKRSKNLGIYDIAKQRILNTFISITRYSIKLECKFVDSFQQRYSKVREICRDDMVKKAISAFDGKDVRLASRIVNLAIKNRLILPLLAIMRYKNTFNR